MGSVSAFATAKHRQRKRAEGLVHLCLWVPSDRVESLKLMAADLCRYPDLVLMGVLENPPEQ